MGERLDLDMDEIFITSEITTVSSVNFKHECNLLKEEIEAQKQCIDDMEKEYTYLLGKEREINQKAIDEKCAMIRELRQQIYIMAKENNQLKTEIKAVIQESARQREEHVYFIKQNTKKEKEAFSCFSAALQAKNHVLGKLIKQLETIKTQLAQLQKTSRAQKQKYKVMLEIADEKYKQSLALKDEEIYQLKKQLIKSSSSSTPPASPTSPPNEIFAKKREVLQKQVEDMCRILDTQNDNNTFYFDQIENTIAEINKQNWLLKSEVLHLQEEVKKRDAKIYEKKVQEKLNNKKIVSKEAIMENIRENMVRLISHSQTNERRAKDLVIFLRDMRKVLREVKRRALSTSTDSGVDENESSVEMEEKIEDSMMKMGKRDTDKTGRGEIFLGPKNVTEELNILDTVSVETENGIY